jgi:hypothetical protein
VFCPNSSKPRSDVECRECCIVCKYKGGVKS